LGVAVAGAGAATGFAVDVGSVVTGDETSFRAAVGSGLRGGFSEVAGRSVAVVFPLGAADAVGDAVRSAVGVGVGAAVRAVLGIAVTTGRGGSVETGGSNALVGAALGV